MPSNNPRWHCRFESFARAHALLREAIDLANQRPLADLERAGVIQRFEFTWELAWKLLNDLLSAEGVQLETVTPRSVLRSAYQARLISDGDNWMRALDARSQIAHSYDSTAVERVVDEIARTYLALFDDLHARVRERSNEPQSPR